MNDVPGLRCAASGLQQLSFRTEKGVQGRVGRYFASGIASLPASPRSGWRGQLAMIDSRFLQLLF